MGSARSGLTALTADFALELIGSAASLEIVGSLVANAVVQIEGVLDLSGPVLIIGGGRVGLGSLGIAPRRAEAMNPASSIPIIRRRCHDALTSSVVGSSSVAHG